MNVLQGKSIIWYWLVLNIRLFIILSHRTKNIKYYSRPENSQYNNMICHPDHHIVIFMAETIRSIAPLLSCNTEFRKVHNYTKVLLYSFGDHQIIQQVSIWLNSYCGITALSICNMINQINCSILEFFIIHKWYSDIYGLSTNKKSMNKCHLWNLWIRKSMSNKRFI